MKICLIDPGLDARTGHYFEWSLKLAREARQRSIDVVIGASASASPDALDDLKAQAEVVAIFSVPPYPPAPPSALFGVSAGAQEARHRSLARILGRELGRLPACDRWIFPSLTIDQAAACALLADRPPVAGCVHRPPDAGGLLMLEGWRQALAALQRGAPPARIGATTPPLADAYTALGGGPVAAWPMPHEGAPAASPRGSLKTIGIFGHQRTAKGFKLLPRLVDLLLRQNLQVLLHDSAGRVDLPPRPGLQLIHGFVDDFAALVARCDLVIAPYDPVEYRLIASGVVWEALASGVPVLAPAASYPGDLVERTGAGLCFAEHGADSIGAALATAQASYPQLATAAFEASRHWPAQHGIGRFLDCALEL